LFVIYLDNLVDKPTNGRHWFVILYADDILILALTWVETLKYLGIYLMCFRSFKCSFVEAKRRYFRSLDAIFVKVCFGRSRVTAGIQQMFANLVVQHRSMWSKHPGLYSHGIFDEIIQNNANPHTQNFVLFQLQVAKFIINRKVGSIFWKIS
jgi:hypothetical protein